RQQLPAKRQAVKSPTVRSFRGLGLAPTYSNTGHTSNAYNTSNISEAFCSFEAALNPLQTNRKLRLTP
ncbi:MAG: hypothetical protein ACI974_000543, partial [Paraglaciecola sp.]